MKENVDILNQKTELYEKVTDAATYKQAAAAITELDDRLAKLREEFKALPEDRRVAAEQLRAKETKEPIVRMIAAKNFAAKTVAASKKIK